jgi:uncharacterized membrane protein
MVQQQLMNDPRIANNPMMRQGMEQALNNPELFQQVSELWSNPEARQRIMAMAPISGDGRPESMMETMLSNPQMLQSMMQVSNWPTRVCIVFIIAPNSYCQLTRTHWCKSKFATTLALPTTP